MMITELPFQYRARAERYRVESFRGNTIDGAFSWGDTVEGVEFWRRCRQAKSKEFLPVIDRDLMPWPWEYSPSYRAVVETAVGIETVDLYLSNCAPHSYYGRVVQEPNQVYFKFQIELISIEVILKG